MDYVIACIDGSVINNAVCDAAAWVGSRLNKPLYLLHTLEKQPQHGADDLSGAIGLGAQSELLDKMAQLDEQRAQLTLTYGKALLAGAEDRARSAGASEIESHLRHGDFVESLVELEPKARMMVVGKTGLDHAGQFTALGSHIETLIRQVHTSVLIAPPHFATPTNFMLAYDGRETADKSLERVIAGGLLTGLKCHLVMVKNADEAREEKLNLAAERLTSEGFDVETALLEGPIFDTLKDYQVQQEISFLIMGAFAHSKVRRLFLGSNTIRMIEDATIPLIVLR